MIIHEIIEDATFDYKDERVIESIMDKIENFIDESKGIKMIKLNREFVNFKQTENDTADEYVSKFGNLETKLKNEGVKINDMFLAAHMLNKSTFSQQEKENIMSSIDMDKEETVLKDIKTKSLYSRP